MRLSLLKIEQSIGCMKTIQDFLSRQNYFERFSSVDLSSRSCKDCRQDYASSLRELTHDERAFIEPACIEAMKHLSKYPRLHRLFSRDRILVFESGEYPFPHTHGDVIMMPRVMIVRNEWEDTRDMAKLLIHELIHIFQRKYPAETNVLLVSVWGNKIRFPRNPKVAQDPMWRSNPDVNDIVYQDEQGEFIVPLVGIQGKLIDSRDHPYEIMAYRLADIITGVHKGDERTLAWMKKYLSS